ncbi:NrfD/PsrC family molybdoenzyme membrane anchor subunit [Candidatus Laterigemmans baculatus]|uniref:NrfD/PsrC family molybdoenzyme membrane anchor subunit n=1 Tax=Candidatus Laterigemmans baculatus TaxID=2770505 RepID=UPI0013D9F2F2|nr:NrfD/PsrC family molybdoenzyme membrane anchor subunit [Candidatus Laterigemmans baculatus]
MKRPGLIETGRNSRAIGRRDDRSPQGEDRDAEEAGYYDLSMLKPPVWKWEIASYFFLGGLSAGAYLLSRLAARFGGRSMEGVRSVGTAVAAIAALPCAPLLIKDLGHMSRFHHMLRVVKPESPMSVGTWALTVYSAAVALSAVQEWLGSESLDGAAKRRIAAALERGRPIMVTALDGAGIPAALVMISYTGVLVSCTAIPAWSRQAWLSPLFVASGMSTAAASIQLGLAATREGEEPTAAEAALEKIESVARLAEAVSLGGYLRSAGPLARPLTHGKLAHHTLLAAAALAIPEAIHHLLPGKPSRWKTYLAAGITLAGGMSLRWAVVHAGRESANDPHAARQASGPSHPEQGRLSLRESSADRLLSRSERRL